MDFDLSMGAPFQRTKLFRAFRAAVGTYAEIPEWTANGDFRARFLLVIPATDGIYRFASGSDAMARFGINVVGGVGSVVTAQIDGAWESANNKSLPTGQLTLFEYERINSVFTIRVNSVEKHTSTSSVAPVMLDQLFVDNNGSSNHFDGYALLAYLQDLSTPSNSRRYSRFCEPSGIVPNDLAALGTDLVTTNAISIWNGLEASFSTKQLGVASISDTVLVQVSFSNVNVHGQFKIDSSDEDSGWFSSAQGTATFTMQGGQSFYNLQKQAQGFVGNVQVSIKDYPGCAQLYNPADGSIQPYTKKGQSWLGPELITQTVWENPNQAGANWSFANDQWVLLGDGTNSPLRLIADSDQPDQAQLITRISDFEADATGRLGYTTSGGAATSYAAQGSFTDIVDKNSATGPQQYKRAPGVVTRAELNRPSMRDIIPIAPGAES